MSFPRYHCAETGHAILDGIRPNLGDTSIQTGAFHEFVADMTAILSALRNNDVRHAIEESVANAGGDLAGEALIGHLAEEFGRYVSANERNYLRSAHNNLTMDQIAGNTSAHYCSQVLTGAMFEIAKRINQRYVSEREKSVPSALWYTFARLQRMALQPLDFLPPSDVQFRDYALAVFHNQLYVDPADPNQYASVMIDVFKERGILEETAPLDLKLPNVRLPYDVNTLFRSKAEIYKFLQENQAELHIPESESSLKAEIYDSYKSTRSGTDKRQLPRAIVLQYMWDEGVKLEGSQFGQLEGKSVALPCGGTLVFDDRRNVISWMRKEGLRVESDRTAGEARRVALLQHIANRVKRHQVALYEDADTDSIQPYTPMSEAHLEDGWLKLALTPHLRDTEVQEEEIWTPSF